MHACGAECSNSSGLLTGAKKISEEYKKSKDIDKRFEAFKTNYYNKPTLTKNGNKITLIFQTCTCSFVENGVKNPYLCNCTEGYTKNIFETLFNRPLKINLLKTILRGDSICEQEIFIL